MIRQRTHAAAKRLGDARWDRTDDARFARAEGVIEAPVDAGKGNTTTGWRDVQVGVFCKRKPGRRRPPRSGPRALPAPTIRAVVANVAAASAFAVPVRAEADRLGVTTARDVTALGDGAERTGNLAAEVLPQAGGVLDIYHALEHIGDAVKASWGATGAATARREAGRSALPAGGKAGIEPWIAEAFPALPAGASGDELREPAAYFAAHPTRRSYGDRLAAGRSIGSGLVEGSVQQRVNRRRKLTGAKWRVEHVGPRVELAARMDTPDGHAVWTAA